MSKGKNGEKGKCKCGNCKCEKGLGVRSFKCEICRDKGWISLFGPGKRIACSCGQPWKYDCTVCQDTGRMPVVGGKETTPCPCQTNKK